MLYYLEHPPPLTCNLVQAHGLPPSTWAQKKYHSSIGISSKRVTFTQPAMDDSNIGVGKHGRTILVDFSSIGLLPVVTLRLLSPTLNNKHGPIPASLGLPGNSKPTSMTLINVSVDGVPPDTRYVNLCQAWKYSSAVNLDHRYGNKAEERLDGGHRLRRWCSSR